MQFLKIRSIVNSLMQISVQIEISFKLQMLRCIKQVLTLKKKKKKKKISNYFEAVNAYIIYQHS